MKRFAKLTLFAAAAFFAGCSGDSPTDPGKGGDTGDVTKYMAELPTWGTFSPLKSEQAPVAIGDPTPLETVTLDVETIDDDGNVEIIPDVTYTCQSQPYTLTENPEQIALYSPDVEILWPGALLQGKSHRDGLGSLLGLPIAERTSIEVSIPSLANNDNFRVVDTPSQAEVAQAIGSMVGAATASGLSTPSTITFKQEAYHSESQFALQAGFSGRYMGFEGSAEGSVELDASKTTVTAQFYQKMFDVVVAPPQSPEAFFSEDFTSSKLQQQVDLGRMGPANLPVYVSNIVYGRMMMFSMSSTASESDIRAAMSAAYDGIGGGGSGNLSTKQKSILQQSEIRVTSLGGDADATIATIRSGNWSDYFTDTADLTSAAPLSYTFRNLSDGSIATVSETTDYNITTCEAKAATPGTFNFLDQQSLGLPISTPAKNMMADVNGDGLMDIVWNHVSAGKNETVVGMSASDGTFTLSAPYSHSVTPADNWGQYIVAVGDYNADGKDDLAFNRVLTTNTTYVMLSNGDGTYTELPEFVRGGGGWSDVYTFKVGNIDGKNGDDLVWNDLTGTNRVYVSFSNADGSFGVDNFEGTTNMWHDHPTTGWQNTETLAIDDVNNDGRDDLIWYTEGSNRHNVYFAVSTSDTQGSIFTFRGLFDRGSNGWQNYNVVVGDVDGKNGADLVWVRQDNSDYPTYVDLATGTGALSGPPAFRPGITEGGPFELRLLDVNGDGKKDLLMNEMATLNRSYIGLGTDTGEFDYGRIFQDHPSFDDWSQFEVLVGDVNGDGREDVIYNNSDASNDVYVGLAKE